MSKKENNSETKIEFKEVRISEIKEDGKNPNRMSAKQFESLKASIQKYGFLVPVILNKELILADGAHRTKAAKELGLESIPAYVVDANDIDRRILRQILNKIKGEHRFELDKEDFELLRTKELESFQSLFSLIDYDKNIQKYLNETEYKEIKDEDDIPEDPPTRVKKGEIWQLGDHRLICGDSTDKSQLEALLEGNKPILLVTDPPYGVSYADKNKFLNSLDKGNCVQKDIINDHKTPEEMKIIWTKAFLNLYELTDQSCSYYIFGPQGGELLLLLFQSILESNWQLKHMMIWVKNNIVLGRSDYNYQHEPILYGWKEKHNFYGRAGESSIWNIDKPTKSKLHPTMKPVSLISKCILNSSKPQDIVIDVFGGSGSTLIACEKLDRKCYMMELDQKYCDIIVSRWEKYTNKKAVKVDV